MMMLECLCHYVMEYHIDGFILNPADCADGKCTGGSGVKMYEDYGTPTWIPDGYAPVLKR